MNKTTSFKIVCVEGEDHWCRASKFEFNTTFLEQKKEPIVKEFTRNCAETTSFHFSGKYS